MQSRTVIFAVTAVLLVPFVYATSSIPDACAAWKAAPSVCTFNDDKTKATCCNDVVNDKTGESVKVCIDCAKQEGEWKCDNYREEARGTLPG